MGFLLFSQRPKLMCWVGGWEWATALVARVVLTLPLPPRKGQSTTGRASLQPDGPVYNRKAGCRLTLCFSYRKSMVFLDNNSRTRFWMTNSWFSYTTSNILDNDSMVFIQKNRDCRQRLNGFHTKQPRFSPTTQWFSYKTTAMFANDSMVFLQNKHDFRQRINGFPTKQARFSPTTQRFSNKTTVIFDNDSMISDNGSMAFLQNKRDFRQLIFDNESMVFLQNNRDFRQRINGFPTKEPRFSATTQWFSYKTNTIADNESMAFLQNKRDFRQRLNGFPTRQP